jgi:hypothetical protein
MGSWKSILCSRALRSPWFPRGCHWLLFSVPVLTVYDDAVPGCVRSSSCPHYSTKPRKGGLLHGVQNCWGTQLWLLLSWFWKPWGAVNITAFHQSVPSDLVGGPSVIVAKTPGGFQCPAMCVRPTGVQPWTGLLLLSYGRCCRDIHCWVAYKTN